MIDPNARFIILGIKKKARDEALIKYKQLAESVTELEHEIDLVIHVDGCTCMGCEDK